MRNKGKTIVVYAVTALAAVIAFFTTCTGVYLGITEYALEPPKSSDMAAGRAITYGLSVGPLLGIMVSWFVLRQLNKKLSNDREEE